MKLKKLAPFGCLLEIKKGSKAFEIERSVIRDLVREHKLVLIRGLEDLAKEDLINLAVDHPSKLVHWEFGALMDLKVDPKAQNYLFSREAVPFHWDGAFHEEPEVLVFHCVEPPFHEGGGETIFADAESLAASITREEQESWKDVRLTYRTEKKAHYGGTFTTKILESHPSKNVSILRYAEPVDSNLNPVSLEIEGLGGSKPEFIARMRERLYSKEHCYVHRWQANDVLLADNFSLLHARNEFSLASARHIRRVQIRKGFL